MLIVVGLRSAQRCVIAPDNPFTSIIVAVRNECDSIVHCLHALLHQEYPRYQFEIIVVDDLSHDCTLKALELFASKHDIILLQNSRQGKYTSSKKSALELAIEHAQGDILLFTDADCAPPPRWMKSIIERFDQNTGLVAGFSPQRSENQTMNDILTMDAAAAAIVSSAIIGYGRGVTCTGRNLAYRKQAYLDIGGFAALPDSLSGDDDFILQAIAKHPQWTVKYAFDARAVVPAVGPKGVCGFLRQKQRHISAGKYYPFSAKIAFASFHLLNLLIWLSAVGVFLNLLFVLPLTAKLVLDFLVLRFFFHRFKMRIKVKCFALWQLLFVYYNSITGPVGFIKKLKW